MLQAEKPDIYVLATGRTESFRQFIEMSCLALNMAMENMRLLWKNQLPMFVVRPFNYTGHGQSKSFLIPKIVAHYARRAKSLSLGNLDIYREFNDVRLLSEQVPGVG